MTINVVVNGLCDSRFNRVRDAFVENLSLRGEVGATVAVTLNGRLIVDLWAGHADAARNHRRQCALHFGDCDEVSEGLESGRLLLKP